MNKPVCTPPQLNFWIICALFMIVAVSPQLDLAVSAFFFRDNRFYLGDWGFFPFLRRGLPEIFIGIAAAFGLIWGWGLLRRRWLWGINTKVMLLTTGSMLLGPILIVLIRLSNSAETKILPRRWSFPTNAIGTALSCPDTRPSSSGAWLWHCCFRTGTANGE